MCVVHERWSYHFEIQLCTLSGIPATEDGCHEVCFFVYFPNEFQLLVRRLVWAAGVACGRGEVVPAAIMVARSMARSLR